MNNKNNLRSFQNRTERIFSDPANLQKLFSKQKIVESNFLKKLLRLFSPRLHQNIFREKSRISFAYCKTFFSLLKLISAKSKQNLSGKCNLKFNYGLFLSQFFSTEKSKIKNKILVIKFINAKKVFTKKNLRKLKS